MNFHLSADQIALQEAVREFVADACDAGGLRRRAFESEDGFDPAFWNGLMRMGVGGIGIAEEHGGMGLDMIDVALVAEVLGHAAAPGPYIGHALAGLAIQLAGSAEQKARWLPRLASGEATGTVGLSDGRDGWRPQGWAVRLADGRLSGRAANILYPGIADVMVVGIEGGRLALVERGAAGIAVTGFDAADRTRRLDHVDFAATPAEPLPGDAGEAVADALLVLLAADAFGGASRILEMTADHARTRVQFGRAIGAFQGVKHQIANLASDVEPGRGLYWYAAVAFDRLPERRAHAAAHAKAHLADRYMQAARTGVELHGGIGYTWDFDLQILVKRALFDFAYGGVPSSHRARAAAMPA